MSSKAKENTAPEAAENSTESQSKKAAKKLAKDAAKAAKVCALFPTAPLISPSNKHSFDLSTESRI